VKEGALIHPHFALANVRSLYKMMLAERNWHAATPSLYINFAFSHLIPPVSERRAIFIVEKFQFFIFCVAPPPREMHAAGRRTLSLKQTRAFVNVLPGR
jgi:hypothetical protein